MSKKSAPLIADVRRNALDDGPGIRSTIFFKGCPLSCVWCQNPECISPAPELQHDRGSCIGCGECARRCPHGAARFEADERRHDAERCRLCEVCVEGCPPGGLRRIGTALSAGELVERVLVDEVFFSSSGGGVTFSGGEPTMFLSYLTGVARLLKDRGVHLLLETCGHYPSRRFEADLLPLLDTIYFDLKLFDPGLHRQMTGMDNGRIVENLERLVRLAPEKLQVRVPLVPRLTATRENLTQIARFLLHNGQKRVVLLPYNPLWTQKAAPGPLIFDPSRFMTSDEVETCRGVMVDAGLTVL
jgi:pyruvate formate lyase activating enzyme